MSCSDLPFDDQSALEMLDCWQSQFGLSDALAARVLGVSRRTVLRWRAQGRAPARVAHMLDQLERGAWLRSHVERGAWAAGRDNLVREFLFGRRV